MTYGSINIAKDRQEAKAKGDRNQIKGLNAVFQQLACRDKESYYSNQCKETEDNNKKEEQEIYYTRSKISRENVKQS